jgi:hypothetical protein
LDKDKARIGHGVNHTEFRSAGCCVESRRQRGGNHAEDCGCRDRHTLEFSKEGFNTGKFPLEITSRDASGGSVSYESGSPAHDTIELRDGSVLSGDLVSISGMQVQVRIGGNTQTFDRHQIKRILLTERDPVAN